MQEKNKAPKVPYLEKELDKVASLINEMRPNLPKDVKHTLGQMLINMELEIYRLINRAFNIQNNEELAEERHAYLTQAYNLLYDMSTVLRKGKYQGFIAKDRYIKFIEPLGNCLKQITGWINKDNERRASTRQNNSAYGEANLTIF